MFLRCSNGLFPVLHVLVGSRIVHPVFLFVMRTAPVHFGRFALTIAFHKKRIFKNTREKHAEIKLPENEWLIKVDAI
jgi:hypothetical protein